MEASDAVVSNHAIFLDGSPEVGTALFIYIYIYIYDPEGFRDALIVFQSDCSGHPRLARFNRLSDALVLEGFPLMNFIDFHFENKRKPVILDPPHHPRG